jgi:hypothetical protein
MDMIKNLGEPYSGDSKFVAKCRKLQSIYRAEQGLAIRPYKGRDGIHYYGNYIEGGEKSGANFLADYIFKYAKYRVDNRKKYETIESDRLFNNLLSSQPMAFNLFCPLRKLQEESPEEATRVIKSALPMFPIHVVTKVDLEFIPSNYKELTGDKSAMDAIICFKTADGKDGFIAIETKYSENLGTNEASDNKKSLEIIKQIKCFNTDVEAKIKSKQLKLTQIYRNFLLSESYGLWSNADPYSIILSPKIHPSTEKEVRSITDEMQLGYKGKLQNISLESFTDKLISESPEEYAEIFRRFRDRYLSFDRVE